MKDEKEEALTRFLKKSIDAVPSAPHSEFDMIQSAISAKEERKSFWDYFRFPTLVPVAVTSMALATVIALVIHSQNKTVTMTSQEYIEFLFLNDEGVSDRAVGADWL
ncbi:MAG: hypothetical protein COW00_16915 [Bdellovibrio sp. CG12_big_fil_rev_8_21_14_0_65_39_13]|nr:MAG: hypothetical protein COW78_00085 [Bdellovibrio sp. CG22_combo_CG10-13_8_21_14_all_39_27]PIQ58117.1 MAG: hypothetical protein COW00_16915 [Bdellovibrio sp. CG12_big_fil_rev_8_21_14_0_65_39_13]PIR34279.1 MAG: hypothetical protein COV37_13155 [Bdellovibrio sp. CG11_big_fil_rev_8_21_14_0_20_39_38]PJB52244.1 MAG: hypothetical protein CO099_13610 [Bdellovibrio sp. CG_4_9_14_3_um_filter_39_7]